MKFIKIYEARKNPKLVKSLDLSLHSTNKIFENHNYDSSDISELIGDLSIFENLETLSLSAFPVDKKLLSSIWKNQKLKTLIFWNVELNEVPDGLKELPLLENLHFQYETKIKVIPTWIGQLTKLKKLSFYGCEKIENLPMEIANLFQLEDLILGENRKLNHIPFNIKKFPKLKPECIKDIEILIKKLDKKLLKKLKKNSTELNKYLSKFEDKPCLLNYDGLKWQGILYSWEDIDDFSRLNIEDQLDDEMSENEKLVPFATFSCIDEILNFNNCEEYFEKAEQPELYLMLNLESNYIFESGKGETRKKMKDLKIHLKNSI